MEEPLKTEKMVTETTEEGKEASLISPGIGLGLCYGALLGVVGGVIFSELAFGLSLGAVLGVVVGAVYDEVHKRD